MMFWILCALLTLAAFIAALAPFLRNSAGQTAPAAHDLAVYKDQLAEIDTDMKRGLISESDAESAKFEVSRRLLKADASSMVLKTNTSKTGMMAASLALVAVPVIAWGGYAMLGSPMLPDLPVSARNEPVAGTDGKIAELLSKAEEHLKANPKDGRGWAVIAPIYLRMGRFQQAIDAYGAAISNSEPSAMLEVGLGQALAAQNNGMVDARSMEAFKRAIELDPANPEPKVMIATAYAQQGKLAEAKAEFQAILDAAPKDAPWRANIEGAVKDIELAMNPKLAKPAMKGPSQADIDAAANMSEVDRVAMIEGMVANLAIKLEENPNDPEGWQRLIRSYAMLKKPDEAKAALSKAVAALASNAAALSQIKAMAGELGLETP